MKQSIRQYGPVALLLAGIVAVSGLLTLFTGQVTSSEETITVVATTYPLYLAAKNVVGDTPGVTVQTLTGSASGCLHDYQLSPADRLRLDTADLVLLNGAGGEVFLEDLLESLPGQVVDTSAGLSLLAGCHEHHDHHHDHEEVYNEHLWAGPAHYAGQIAAVTKALSALDAANGADYTARGEAYEQAVKAAGQRLQQAVAALPSRRCIIFHDSLAYLAADCGLTVELALTVGEDAGVSAGDLSAAQQLLAEDPGMLVLYDDQYTVRYTAIDALVPSSHVLALDTGVTGDGGLTDWLDAMAQNAALLEGKA